MANKNNTLDKKFFDRRYIRTEKSILEVMAQNPNASVKHISKMAHISRSTFYRHHRAVMAVADDCEEYLRSNYRCRLEHLKNHNEQPLRSAYRDALFFILRNKQFFQVLVLKMKMRAFALIVEELRPRFEVFAGLPKNSEKIFQIYAGEVAVVLSWWSDNGFRENEMSEVLNDIMCLSRTARPRLMPLMRER